MKNALLFTLMLFGIPAMAQHTEWIDVLSTGGSKTVTTSMVDSEGNSFIAGYFQGTCDFDPGTAVYEVTATTSTQPFLLKLNPNGDFEFVHVFAGDGILNTKRIIRKASGELLMAGVIAGTVSFGTTSLVANDVSGFVCQLAADGTGIWAFKMGNNVPFTLKDMALASDGSLWIGAEMSGGINLDGIAGNDLTTPANNNGVMIHYNANGQYLGSFVVNVDGATLVESVSADEAGNVYFGGSTYTSFSKDAAMVSMTNTGYAKGYVVRMSNDGVGAAGQVYGDDTVPVPGISGVVIHRLCTDNQGRLWLAGKVTGSVDLLPGSAAYVYYGEGNGQAVLWRMHQDTVEGALGFPNTGGLGSESSIRDMAPDLNGNVVVCGSLVGTLSFPSLTLMYSFSGSDAFVLEADLNGGALWGGVMQGDLSSTATGIGFGADGSLFMAGGLSGNLDVDPFSVFQQVAAGTSQGVFAMKIQQDAPTGVLNLDGAFDALYPNPAKDYVFGSTMSSGATLRIWDARGALVKSLQGGNAGIWVGDLKPGVYMMETQSDRGLRMQRFVKE
jgi:hypothetical protein